MNRVVSAVAGVLLNGNAVLLPDVHDWFCYFAGQQSHNLSDICVSKLGTSANIPNTLIGTLQHHITYTCSIKTYGTLIYRPDIDLTAALTRTLWRLRQTNLNPEKSISCDSVQENDGMKPITVLEDLNY